MYNACSITYNGVTSETLGALYCRVENTSSEDIYASEREIKQDMSGRNWGNKSRNYLYKIQRTPQKFKIELGFTTLTDDIARTVSKLFCQDKFLPLIPNDTNRIYYCMPVSSKISYVGGGGYISFDMVTFDEYSYSSLVTITKDYTGNTTAQFNITNEGDVSVYPELTITPLVSESTVKLTNITNSNKYIEFTTDGSGNQLVANEVIVVDCEKEIITTNQLGLYRYDNMTTGGDYLELLSGVNTIKVDGSMLLTIKYKNKYLF